MTDKAPDAYRTISEVAEDLDLPQHVLRFWETRFGQIKPLKRGGGRRYYRPDDVELLKGIRFLLYSEGYTIKGVQRILKEQGPKAVQALMRAEVSPADEEELAPERMMPAPPPPQPVARPMPPPEPLYPPIYEEPRWTSAPPAPVVAQPPAAQVPSAGYRDVDPPAPVQPELPELPPLTSPSAFRQAPRTSAPSYIEPDLFQQPVAPPVPVVSPPVAPPAPVTPPGPATVSFMRGGLSKPVVPESGLRAVPPPVSRQQVEPPARYVPLHDGEVEPSLPPLPTVRSEPAPRNPGLSADQRRALQAALFELSECRRMIERVRG